MKEIAEVIEEKSDSVLVKVERHSACSKCDKDCSLQDSEQDKITVELDKNSFQLNIGQKVMLEMDEGNMVFSAIIVYLFPLLSMISGYFITLKVANIMNMNVGQGTGIIGSTVFLIISFYIIKKINYILKSNKNFQPKIVKIIE